MVVRLMSAAQQSETIDPNGPAPFDPSALAPEPTTLPPIGTDEPVIPDHTASETSDPGAEPGSERLTARERVRRARERATGNAGTPATPRAGVPAITDAKLRKALTQIYMTGALGVMPFDATCANVVMMNAEKCADSLVTAAQTNPNIRRALIALTETGAWGGVMIAHLPIIAAVAWHHSPSRAVRDTIAPLAAAVAGIDTVALSREADNDE